ncbi:SRPBCC family protein [Mycolicibacterium hodleri]|uniref:SRPBCC family protein n=1 Tax=Mycolicibacterium hodleri TaxID=49897 RepID=A0A502E8Z5_9MYCO|nr:SRPBCC family protein [Mycolicibacterium hodleri]TPG33854.1 SRPBCC family protein [Mycolicibacterium hodleri]
MANGDRWWLTSSEHIVSDEVPAEPSDVRAFYCDLQNITELHPLVVSVETIHREETADSYTQIYRVRDRIPIGPLRPGITYTARVQVPRHGDVLTEARQFPHVLLSGRVSFDQVAGGTRLTERLRIQAPRLLAAITVREAVAAHTEMLAGIRRSF